MKLPSHLLFMFVNALIYHYKINEQYDLLKCEGKLYGISK